MIRKEPVSQPSKSVDDLVRAAIESGKLSRVPSGVTGLIRKPKKIEPEPKFHAELCGKGGRVLRHNFIDEIDGDWS